MEKLTIDPINKNLSEAVLVKATNVKKKKPKTILEYKYTLRCGHNISIHPKCSNIHGEFWIITITLYKKDYDPTADAYIMDFGDIKTILDSYFSKYDHKFMTVDPKLHEAINKIKPNNSILMPMEPSCENLSYFWLNELNSLFNSEILQVRVCESEESKCATTKLDTD
jgi:6-pyruvoyl-tetrahydropterin synthase